jgi:hypothetical protein
MQEGELGVYITDAGCGGLRWLYFCGMLTSVLLLQVHRLWRVW